MEIELAKEVHKSIIIIKQQQQQQPSSLIT